MVPKEVYDAVHRHSNQKHDVAIRRFVVINCPQLFDVAIPPSINATMEAYKLLIEPESLEDCTIFNCLFLRFPELSPHWGLRAIKGEAMFLELVKVRVAFVA
jgi:hypothetical protein